MSALDRLVDTVRHTVLGVPRTVTGGRTLLDDATLFEAHDHAERAAADAVHQAQSAGATAQQQRSALDAVADRAALLVQHGRDLRGTARVVRDALERVKLVAINAALEGSRSGDAAGGALVLVGDEIRTLVSRALDACEEQGTLLEQAEADRDTLRVEVDDARARAGALAEELLRSQAAQTEASTAVTELGSHLHRATGTDPEVAAAAAQAAEHARGLLQALSALSVRTQGNLVLRALRPSIEPILRTIRDLDRKGDGGDRS